MIYLVSHYYPPESNPPANRFRHLAKILMDRYGQETVQVITGRPNHPDGVLPPGFRGRLWKKRYGPNGEKVLSLWEIPAPNEGFRRKSLGFVSFSISIFFYFLFKRMKKEDIIYVTSPPVFAMYVLWFLSRFKRNFRYALDIRDLMPQIVAGMGFIRDDTMLYKILLGLVHRSYHGATKINGVVEGICEYIDGVIEPDKTSLIYNPMDTDLLRPLPDNEVQSFRKAHPTLFGDPLKTTFLFAGSHAVYMDLIGLMKSLDLLKKETTQFLFILIGYGEEKEHIMRFATEHGLDDVVTFLPYQEREELVKYMCAVDFCYSSTINAPIYQMVIPTKVLEYMACNKFVVSVHDCPFAEMLKDLGHTLLVFPERHDEIRDALLELINKREQYLANVNTRAFIESEFSHHKFHERIIAFFEELLPDA